jgi:hypothetical protein
MKKFLFLALSIVGLFGCSQQGASDHGGTIIESPGTFHCFKDRLVVNVVHAPGNRLNYTVGNKKASAGPAKPAIMECAPWVIFPEAPNKVWIYDGAKDVTLIELSGDGGTKFTSSQVVPAIVHEAPAEFVRHLPAALSDARS